MENEKLIRILAIETSCDETAAAVIGEENGQPIILSNIISSQADLHAKTGGVVPEVASRAHMESIMPVIAQALINSKHEAPNPNPPAHAEQLRAGQILNSNIKESNVSDFGFRISDFYPEAIRILDSVTYIAVTAGPGLIGSLLVGYNAAKSLAYARDLPLIAVNHIEGHIYSAFGGERSKKQAPNPNPPAHAEQLRAGQIPNYKSESYPHILPLSKGELEEVGNEAMKQSSNETIFPLIALTVSGGHTSLTLMKDHGVYETLGATLDDAVGEAYDKVAKLLGLGYPGGPAVSKLAREFRDKLQNPIRRLADKSQINSKIQSYPHILPLSKGELEGVGNRAIEQLSNEAMRSSIAFPRPIINDGTFNFSFSGLKTAVLQKTKDLTKELNIAEAKDLPAEIIAEICYAFEEAVAEVLVTKTVRAIKQYGPKAVVFAGGVSANGYLRKRLEYRIQNTEYSREGGQMVRFLTPSAGLYGDNAAMIGLATYYHVKRGAAFAFGEAGVPAPASAGCGTKYNEIKVDSNWELVS